MASPPRKTGPLVPLEHSPQALGLRLPLLVPRPVPQPQPPEKRQRTAEFYFEPAVSDVFPPRPAESHPIQDYMESLEDPLPPEENYLVWVPDNMRPPTELQKQRSRAAFEAASAVEAAAASSPGGGVAASPGSAAGSGPSANKLRPRTGYHAAKIFPHLPLEFCDSPELELLTPQERLAQQAERQAEAAAAAAAGADDPAAPPPGLPAYSRWYNTHGVFTWKQCCVLGYQEHR